MFLQLDYYTDILKDLHTSIYFIFLFDRPCGNGRGREDTLNITNMKRGYFGAQKYMHPTNINQEVGYLGTHEWFI